MELATNFDSRVNRLTAYFSCSETEHMCLNCKHYEQHIIDGKERQFPWFAGNCNDPDFKMVFAWDVCEHFEPKVENDAPQTE